MARTDGVGAYLDMLAPRLEAAASLLRDDGTIWVHLDWRAAYLVRVVLDEILGRDAFMNEIVWRRAPNLGRQAASAQFGRTLDTIVVYGKKDAKIHSADAPRADRSDAPCASTTRTSASRPRRAATTPTRRSRSSTARGAFIARRAAACTSNIFS